MVAGQKNARMALVTLIRDIINSRSQHEESPSLILVGRRDDDDWWAGQSQNCLNFPAIN